MTPVEEQVRAEIIRRGPIPFDEVVERALYSKDGGFYAAGGQAGRRGDFLTSPEVGPLFGAVVARFLDACWDEAARPATFVVVEAGAGAGTLARAILAAEPRCASALRYVLVERSAGQRAQHAELQSVSSLADLPPADGPCTVLANELLDNIPFGLLERTAVGWSEVHVGLDGEAFIELLLPAETDLPTAPVGARIPRHERAAGWVREAIALAGSAGRVVAFDYASTSADLARRPWHEWLRTYRQHVRGTPPLEGLGTQDITCEVAVDQLPEPTSNRSQAEWLRAHGIDDLVAEARQAWEERAAIGDLAAIRARSRANEATALLDTTGLGAFRVLEWTGSAARPVEGRPLVSAL